MQGDALESPVNELLTVRASLFGSQSAQSGHALLDHLLRHRRLGVQRPSRRARPGRKREKMQVTERQRAHKLQRLVEFAIGLARKTSHHIRAESQIRSSSANQSRN